MGKNSPKPVYEFGELEKTRKNLGDIPPEEARRLASLLGGETGTEKDNHAVTRSYNRISRENRRRTDLPVPAPARADSDGEPEDLIPLTNGKSRRSADSRSGRAPMIIDSRKRKPPARKEKPNYWVQMRMNFLAARKEHNIKTLSSALVSLFPFLRSRDSVNPRFVKAGHKYLYDPIISIQKKSERLLAGTARRGSAFTPDPFYREILEILSKWDVQTLFWEITRLENSGRNLPFESFVRFCRSLFTPVIRFQNLEQKEHIAGAVRHYYELNRRMSGPGEEEERARINSLKKDVMILLELLPVIFHRIHYSCYPLLMKLCSTSFSPYEEFYSSRQEDYLPFLDLKKEDILVPPGLPAPVVPEENQINPVIWTAPEEEPLPVPMEFSEGLILLQEMFPQAGFEDLTKFPDLQPYFAPLFSFPRNFELLPPSDPLHSITVLMSILKELFFGFGTFQFGPLKSEEWDLPDIRPVFEEYTGHWFRYLEDYLPRLILSPLLEYCRGVEKGAEFMETEYAGKIESELLWYKRSLFLSHMKLHRTNTPRPPLPPGIRKLGHLTDDLTNLLITILKLSREDIREGGIWNLAAPIRFTIETPVSARYLQILRKRKLPPANSELVRDTARILCVLNEFLANPDSLYYRDSPRVIFRSLNSDLNRPVYSLRPLNTMEIIRDWDDRIKTLQAEAVHLGREPGHTPEDLTADLELCLINLKKARVDSVLIYLRINSEVPDDPMEAVLHNTLRDEGDHWYRTDPVECVLLLEDTSADGAVVLSHRLLKQLIPLYEPSVMVSVGITPLAEDWTKEEALFRGKNTLREAEKKDSPVIVLFDGIRKKYRIFASASPVTPTPRSEE